MFKRKKTTEDEQVLSPEVAASLLLGAAESEEEPRTTCYPKDGEPPPAVLGQPRTTVYRQAVKWNRGGYDTIN